MVSFVRISALLWADLLAAFAMYVMMTYLTNVWSLSTTHAAGIINFWDGITASLPIVFAYFVDSFMNDYYMLLLSSIAYTIGLGLLSMSTPPVLGPCSEYKEECIGHTQKVLFYIALPLIAVGMAGHVVSLMPFLDLQTNTEDTNKEEDKDKDKETVKKEKDKEKESKIFWQMGGLLIVVVVLIAGGIALPYIKPWSIRFGIPAICTLVATLLFLTGYYQYKPCKPADGSPLTVTLRVFVSAARNFSRPVDAKQLYYEELDTPTRSTRSLRCLDKAAITLSDQPHVKSWKLCSVREVEDTKIGMRMIPMWLTFIVIGIVLSIGNTYFIEQANRMDRTLGKIKITIPIFLLFYTLSSTVFTYFYSLLTVCLPNKKYAPPVGIATSMILTVLCCITAAKVETRRLHVIRDHGLLDKPDEKIPMSIFWLLPQFMLLAGVDGIANTSITSFFKHQAPESMRKYLGYFTKGVLGLGTMASVVSVYIVGKVSERNQKPNWFQPSLNESRLDRYYWTLSGISAANLVIYVIIAFFYTYKESPDDVKEEAEPGNIDEGYQENSSKCFCC